MPHLKTFRFILLASHGGGGSKRGGGGPQASSGGSDLFFVTSAEGKIQLVNAKSWRLDKSADAHRGACLSAKWSPDGAAIVSGGEDGAVKIWSKSVMLR